MANRISDETIEYVGILAKLELSGSEKEKAREDMEKMLDYIDTLNELDTEGVEPMAHVFPANNVFREDVVTLMRPCLAMRRRKRSRAIKCPEHLKDRPGRRRKPWILQHRQPWNWAEKSKQKNCPRRR